MQDPPSHPRVDREEWDTDTEDEDNEDSDVDVVHETDASNSEEDDVDIDIPPDDSPSFQPSPLLRHACDAY